MRGLSRRLLYIYIKGDANNDAHHIRICAGEDSSVITKCGRARDSNDDDDDDDERADAAHTGYFLRWLSIFFFYLFVSSRGRRVRGIFRRVIYLRARRSIFNLLFIYIRPLV